MGSPVFGQISRRNRRLALGILVPFSCVPTAALVGTYLYGRHVEGQGIDLVRDLVQGRPDPARIDRQVISDWRAASERLGKADWVGVSDMGCEFFGSPCWVTITTRRRQKDGSEIFGIDGSGVDSYIHGVLQ